MTTQSFPIYDRVLGGTRAFLDISVFIEGQWIKKGAIIDTGASISSLLGYKFQKRPIIPTIIGDDVTNVVDIKYASVSLEKSTAAAVEAEGIEAILSPFDLIPYFDIILEADIMTIRTKEEFSLDAMMGAIEVPLIALKKDHAPQPILEAEVINPATGEKATTHFIIDTGAPITVIEGILAAGIGISDIHIGGFRKVVLALKIKIGDVTFDSLAKVQSLTHEEGFQLLGIDDILANFKIIISTEDSVILVPVRQGEEIAKYSIPPVIVIVGIILLIRHFSRGII